MIEQLAGIQMADVHLPTVDRRHLVLSPYTQPKSEQKLLLQRLQLKLSDNVLLFPSMSINSRPPATFSAAVQLVGPDLTGIRCRL